MAIVNQPTPLSNELAWNGDKNPIPDTNDGSKGLFSVEYGFPYVTQQPLAQGGIPPQRNDFNGVLNLLSKFIRYFQNGGIFAYSSAMDYSVGMLVRNGDRLYVCKAENGANTSAGVQNISNSNYWNEITLEDTLGDTLTNQLKTVLVTEAEVANNTTDWNSLTESRTYKISGATFSATYHQPVGANGNGELVVLKNGTDTIVQVYYANSTQPDQAGAYHRIYFGGAWTNWVYDITNQGGTINGNLNVDGNLGVTGNSNINGKLTVDSLDIKNNFTVAGGSPVTGEDLQKIQDQIISPLQTFYVSNNGSDDNDGLSLGTAFKTFSPIFTKVKKDVPALRIYIDNTCEDLNYILSQPFDFNSQIGKSGTNGKSLTITPTNYNTAINKENRATIYVPYGKAFSNYGSSNRYDYYGNILASSCTSISLIGLNIKLQNKSDNKYSGFLLNSPNITITRSFIELQDYDLSNTFWNNSITGINLVEHSEITGSGYLINASSVNRYTTDPSLSKQTTEQTEEISTLAVTQDVYVERLITGLNTSIDSNILNKGNHACTSDVYVNFSNIGS